MTIVRNLVSYEKLVFPRGLRPDDTKESFELVVFSDGSNLAYCSAAFLWSPSKEEDNLEKSSAASQT